MKEIHSREICQIILMEDIYIMERGQGRPLLGRLKENSGGQKHLRRVEWGTG